MRRLFGVAAAAVKVAVCAWALAGAPGQAQAQTLPSTFAPTIGSALLCRSALDNAYFHSYLTTSFGPAYKHEGGAYWFRLDATLWGKAVKEVMVSDDTSPLVFVAAVADSKPEELEEAIRASAGIRHRAVDASAFPLRVSNPGSVIAYQNNKSKIYCARYKPLPPGP
ncbi:hypothetical protein [Massilia sp.]|uniref:hypothetical protein n=1 Tax=Massilia sp. TaxID=1882437 RepID=UPI0028B1FDA2|nr:hypothetical protein [Massilia sp.]